MYSKTKVIILLFTALIVFGLVWLFTYVPKLSDSHGIISTKLYLGKGANQPLIVAFGGGGGGNDWARDYMTSKRDSLNEMGYAVLAVGYFNYGSAPQYLDRISLNAISDSIMIIAQHPQVNSSNIALLGGSKGGELVLNLASKFDHYNAVIALSTSHVTFPALTWSANTSSWMYNDEEVSYVQAPLKTIGPALKGDLFTAHSMMLEDEVAVERAIIEVEKIKGPVLVVSGTEDNQWPATMMSHQIVERLKKNKFKYYYKHMALDGGHTAPLEQFELVYDFLENHFPVG